VSAWHLVRYGFRAAQLALQLTYVLFAGDARAGPAAFSPLLPRRLVPPDHFSRCNSICFVCHSEIKTWLLPILWITPPTKWHMAALTVRASSQRDFVDRPKDWLCKVPRFREAGTIGERHMRSNLCGPRAANAIYAACCIQVGCNLVGFVACVVCRHHKRGGVVAKGFSRAKGLPRLGHLGLDVRWWNCGKEQRVGRSGVTLGFLIL
jgi:hypothetical protein